MGMAITKKIIATATSVENMKPGNIHTVNLDRLMSSGGTMHLTTDMYRNQLKHPRITDASKLVFIVDRNVPVDNPKMAMSQKRIRGFTGENGIGLWERKGVCHQVMMEHYVRPGELIFGTDSHTCTYKALGASGTSMGYMDYLYGMVTRTSWVLVPKTVKFNLIEKLRPGVYPGDLMLTIIGQVGANGCNCQVMEFTGKGVKTLSVSNRMVLCNLAVGAGAKTRIMEADEITLEYLEEHGQTPKAMYHSNEDAVYVREYTSDLSRIEPMAAGPNFVDNVMPVSEVAGITIDEAFLGSCGSGRIDNLQVDVAVIKGEKVAEHVRSLVVPASNDAYQWTLKERPTEVFMEAGAIVMNASYSVCWGSCQGVIGENEVLISTGTRNFRGRAGHPSSKVYLVPTAAMAASAVAGVITTADQLM